MTTPALFIQQFDKDPVLFLMVIAAVVISIVLHELGHGVAAIWQGDDTPRLTGHMTLNPLVHMPPPSWILLIIAGIAYGLMPVNPTRFRSRYGNALVAAAGPTVNLILSFLSLTALGLWIRAADLPGFSAADRGLFFLFELGRLNLVLCVFNLLPIPPLDGSTVLADFSPGFRRLARDPEKQVFFTGAFLLIFFLLGDQIWSTTETLCLDYLRLLVVR